MKRIEILIAVCAMALMLLAGCTTQLSQADRALLNQALEASKSAQASASQAGAAASRAEAAADRAQAAAQRAEDAAAKADECAAKCEKAFEMGQRK